MSRAFGLKHQGVGVGREDGCHHGLVGKLGVSRQFDTRLGGDKTMASRIGNRGVIASAVSW